MRSNIFQSKLLLLSNTLKHGKSVYTECKNKNHNFACQKLYEQLYYTLNWHWEKYFCPVLTYSLQVSLHTPCLNQHILSRVYQNMCISRVMPRKAWHCSLYVCTSFVRFGLTLFTNLNYMILGSAFNVLDPLEAYWKLNVFLSAVLSLILQNKILWWPLDRESSLNFHLRAGWPILS